jgi:hypothetical protein
MGQDQRKKNSGSKSPQPDRMIEDSTVRDRAHQIYLSRCQRNEPGDDVSDWLKAEQELRGRQESSRSDPRARPAQSPGLTAAIE